MASKPSRHFLKRLEKTKWRLVAPQRLSAITRPLPLQCQFKALFMFTIFVSAAYVVCLCVEETFLDFVLFHILISLTLILA